jgi:hypothetical protein
LLGDTSSLSRGRVAAPPVSPSCCTGVGAGAGAAAPAASVAPSGSVLAPGASGAGSGVQGSRV